MLVKPRLSADTMRMSTRCAGMHSRIARTSRARAASNRGRAFSWNARTNRMGAQRSHQICGRGASCQRRQRLRRLNAPLRATEHGRTCTQRWSIKLAKLLSEPGARANLRAQKRAIATATVLVHGNAATIELPAPLMGGANRFAWSENCWMLAS
jgi:hypothetical protein